MTSVLIPVQRSSPDLNRCLQHLVDHAAGCNDIYVIDGATPDDGVHSTCEKWRGKHPALHYLRHDEPVDSLALCRWAYENIPDTGSNLWIIDPAVAIGPDVLKEITAVLRLYERHAIALPRSNRPGISAIPLSGPELSPDDAHNVWETLRERLPRYQIVPWADAGCLLIGNEILRHFGFFAAGEDEHDYSLRINRYGYSTVLANRAFVRDFAQPLPSPRHEDLSLYLEFDADPVDVFGALAIPHRPRILIDLFHLAPHYYGTADFALNLLRELRILARDEIEFYIDLQPASLEFFLPELQGYRLRSDAQSQLFDLVFKPTQINSWEELDRINRLAPRIAYTILDMIAVRCGYLRAPGRRLLFQKSAEICDRVFTLSNSGKADFAALTGSDVSLDVVHLGTNYGVSAQEYLDGTYVLLMGNSYAHKNIKETLSALATEAWPIVVLGGKTPDDDAPSTVRYMESGNLSREVVRETLAGARVVVYPSHYEGFGLPVLDALALKKPVIVLDNETNRELARLTGDGNLHRIPSLEALNGAIKRVWGDSSPRESPEPRRWSAAAQEYLTKFRELLGQNVDTERLRERWKFLRARRA
ncbi:MAG: glycosyltransferase [Acidobacteriota bacterium]|nr:glycosyltransferase [Acidobacteriota bacterium]